MALIKYYMKDLIEKTEETNANLVYDCSYVKGMTITKEIIPTKADVKRTDLSKFWVVYPEEFVFNPRTHGKKIGLGFNNTKEVFLISWNNIAFRVKKDAKPFIIPEYLYINFCREEWDRNACFNSWGSSTEVFAWETLCDMQIELPTLEVQQKYVDIYNAMVANQKAYEASLEDFRVACEANIDKIKNNSKRTPIGEILELVDKRNVNSVIKEVDGINIEKKFMPSVASVSKKSLHNYKIVEPSQFAFSGMQTGRDKCIRIAYNKTNNQILISPAYFVFKNINMNVDSEFILLWFNRLETDRFGWFLSDSSVRSNLDLDRFYEIQVPTPDIKIQKAISEIFNVYQERKAINEALKSQINDICPILIRGSLKEGALA